jgi:hypothetical protein
MSACLLFVAVRWAGFAPRPCFAQLKPRGLPKGFYSMGGGNNTHSSLMLFILTHAIHIIVLQRKEALAVQANVLTII